MASPIDVFISNLKLLGFEKSAHCKGLLSSVSLTRDMFTRGASNTKQFEATSHFLFKTLDKRQCLRKFKTCWPLQDYMHQSREYRAIAYRWLEEIKHSSVIMQHIALRRSSFEECRGTQFEHIMAAFSTFVLETVLLKDGDRGVDKNVLTLNSEEFSQRIQRDIQQAAQSFNAKSSQLETAKKEWMMQGREIVSKLNERDESSAFSSITEIENKAKQGVEEVMPKIKQLRVKFKESQANKENREFIHRIYTILTTKQSENGIYILPTLPKPRTKPFVLLQNDHHQKEGKDGKEREFRNLFQHADHASSRQLHKVPASPYNNGVQEREIIQVEEEEEEDQITLLNETIPRHMSPYRMSPQYNSDNTPYRIPQLNSTPQRDSTPQCNSTPQQSSTPQYTHNTNTNNNSNYTTPPRSSSRTPLRYMHSVTSVVSSIFPDFGSVESIRHEQPPWTPEGRPSESEHDLFDLNNETPIRGIWSPNH